MSVHAEVNIFGILLHCISSHHIVFVFPTVKTISYFTDSYFTHTFLCCSFTTLKCTKNINLFLLNIDIFSKVCFMQSKSMSVKWDSALSSVLVVNVKSLLL